MPADFNHPALGYTTFCAIKFAGYTRAAQWCSETYKKEDLSYWKIGGARTLIGMTIGGAYGYGLGKLLGVMANEQAPILFFGLLIPIRFFEWWLLIWLFFDRELQNKPLGWRMAAGGTGISFALDIPAILGFFLTAGFWVC